MQHQRHIKNNNQHERGAAAIGAAILVATAISVGAYVMNQASDNAEQAQQLLDDKNAALDTSFGALRRLSQVLQSGDVVVSGAPGSVGEFTAAAGRLAPIASGGTGWEPHPSKKNVLMLKTCSNSQLTEGENFDLPGGATVAAKCTARRSMVTTIRTAEVYDAGPAGGGLWALMHVNTDIGLTGDESDKAGLDLAIDIPDGTEAALAEVGDTCPYKDPALNPAGGPNYTQDFYLGGGRYHAGWIKLGYKNSYATNNVTAGSAWVGISNWKYVANSVGGHGYEWVAKNTATETIENWEFAVQGGYGGNWWHEAHLVIPKVSAGGDPSKCYWWVAARRRPYYGSGCFATGTQITMADGTHKAVETVTGGDFVLNPVTGGATKVARVSAGPEDLPMIRVTIGGKAVDVTTEHPFMTNDGLVRGDALKVGLEVLAAGGQMRPIESLETLAKSGARPMVYNLAVEGESNEYVQHMIEANGVTTGDLHLQEVLTHGKGAVVAVPPPITDVKNAISRLFGVNPETTSAH